MTEVSGATHVARASESIKPTSATPLPNSECPVVDPAARLERGQQGGIWVRGPLTMQGYLGKPRR
jgi:long-subunit acyl-CoA synthetase (AMP-forming)